MQNGVELEAVCDEQPVLRIPGRLCRIVRLPNHQLGNTHRWSVGNATALHVGHVTKPPGVL